MLHTTHSTRVCDFRSSPPYLIRLLIFGLIIFLLILVLNIEWCYVPCIIHESFIRCSLSFLLTFVCLSHSLISFYYVKPNTVTSTRNKRKIIKYLQIETKDYLLHNESYRLFIEWLTYDGCFLLLLGLDKYISLFTLTLFVLDRPLGPP